jgi:alpha-ribazole phosphatase
MTRLILIRHGETDWNLEGRWQGQADVPLNTHGRQQAAQLAQSLTDIGITAIVSSDLSRATETAEELARVTGLSIHLDPRLREIHQGEWQGQRISQIQANYSEALRQRQENPAAIAAPGGETAAQVLERILGAIDEILLKYPNDTVAVISHGYAIALLIAYYRRVPLEQAWDLIPSNGGWQELGIKQNELPHNP